jgi:CHAD domain-containing protein
MKQNKALRLEVIRPEGKEILQAAISQMGFAIEWRSNTSTEDVNDHGSINDQSGQVVAQFSLIPDDKKDVWIFTVIPEEKHQKEMRNLLADYRINAISYRYPALFCLEQLEILNNTGHCIAKELSEELLHDYRVAVRKTRTILDLYPYEAKKRKIKTWRKFFADLSNLTSQLRDMDVLLEYVRGLPDGEQVPKFQKLEKKRNLLLKSLCKFVESTDYNKKLREWEHVLWSHRNKWSSVPLFSVILDQLNSVHRAQNKAQRKQTSNRIHKVRKEVKKTRYLLNLMQCCTDLQFANDLMTILVELQQILGTYHDLDLRERYFTKTKDSKPAADVEDDQEIRYKLLGRYLLLIDQLSTIRITDPGKCHQVDQSNNQSLE